jgi:alkylation response protein AidB-like acyl-CoA dehydrogenase
MSVLSTMERRSPGDDLLAAAANGAQLATARAEALDENVAPPVDDIATLHDSGLLIAPFAPRLGGAGVARGTPAARLLLPILRMIGAANLSLGRLYEGHVNAVGLVAAYGTSEQSEIMAEEARCGALFGVWAADDREGLHLRHGRDERVLHGRKILCSGALLIERPLVTARDEAGGVFMTIPKLRRGERADLSGWTAQGMRASGTGTVDFDGVRVLSEQIVGADDDYHRQPAFSGGAWRFCAVQLGGMEALLNCLRSHLIRTGRGDDPHQAARLGEAAILVETAYLWVQRAAAMAETVVREPEAVAAYVNLARSAVERAGLDLMELVHRSVGLPAFMRPHPIERISRDLATYLRQPGPDRALGAAAAWILEYGDSVALWS